MAQTLLKNAADFETQLAAPVSASDTTATLVSVTDDDGNALANGSYCLTVDLNSASKEYFTCTLTGTALTNIKSITRQGASSNGFARAHRRGAKIVITDWVIIDRITDLLDGTTNFDAGTPLKYDGVADMTGDTNKLATVKYVNDTSVAGAPDASTATKGVSKLSTSPVSPTDPIAVGDNDPRMPTTDEKAAMAGTSGTPSASNKYVTEEDVSDAGASGKIVRLNGTSYPAGDTSLLFSQSYTAGEALTAGDALSLNPYAQTDGGITYDNSTGGTYSNASNQSMSHTVGSGNNRLLLVSVGSTGAPSSVTYNGVGMTLVDSQLVGSGYTVYVYSLVNPSSGANNVTVTGSGIYNIIASSYANCKQTGTVLATSKATAGGTTISATANTIGSSSMVYSVFYGIGLSGTQSNDSTFGTKYQYGVNSLNKISAAQSSTNLFAVDTGIINEQQNISIAGTYGGTGGGSPAFAQIQIVIAPFTTPALAVVKANSNTSINNEPLINFIGFAASTVSTGASVAVTPIGVYSGLSGLTSGRDYYVAQTGSVDSDVTITYGGSTGTLQLGTSSSTEYRFGVSFTLTKPAVVNKITLGLLRTSGSPTGGIIATIFYGTPTSLGASLNYSTRLPASSVTSSYASHDFNFTNAYLPAGTYCIVFTHDTLSNNNFFQLDRDSTANGSIYHYNGSWATNNRTNVVIDYTAGTFTSGQITDYFYGNYVKKVGTAISASALFIDKTSKTGSPISKIHNYTYTAETDGYVMCVYNSGTAGAASIIVNNVTYIGQGAANSDRYTITVPVKKGDIYVTSNQSAATFSFIPVV